MGTWIQKLIARRNKGKKCLVCDKKGEHTAQVHYRYNGGIGEAYLCNRCAKQFDVVAEDKNDESL